MMHGFHALNAMQNVEMDAENVAHTYGALIQVIVGAISSLDQLGFDPESYTPCEVYTVHMDKLQ
jgi:hypothetical protein